MAEQGWKALVVREDGGALEGSQRWIIEVLLSNSGVRSFFGVTDKLGSMFSSLSGSTGSNGILNAQISSRSSSDAFHLIITDWNKSTIYVKNCPASFA